MLLTKQPKKQLGSTTENTQVFTLKYKTLKIGAVTETTLTSLSAPT